MLGISLNDLNLFIDQCGGNKSLFGKTISDVYFEFIETRTNNNKEKGGGQLSLCEIEIENLNINNKNSLYYIHSSHNYLFLDVYESILDFINNSPNNTNADINHNKDIILWWDIFSNNTSSNTTAAVTNDKNVLSNQIYNASSLINNTIFIVSPRYEHIHSAIGWTLFIYKHLQMILSTTNYTPREADGNNSNSSNSSTDSNMCIYEVLFTTQIYTDRYLPLQQQQQATIQTDMQTDSLTESTDDTTTPTIPSPYLSTVTDAINKTDIILTHINTIIQSHTSTSYTQKGHNSDPSEIENRLDDLIIYIALLHQSSDKHSIIQAFTKIASYDLLSYAQTLLQQLYNIHSDIYSNTNSTNNNNNNAHIKHTAHINNIDTTTNTNTNTTDPTLNSPDTASPTSTSSNEVEKEGREDKAFFDYTTTQSLHLTPLVSLGFVDYYDDDIHRGQNYDQSGGGKRVRREGGGVGEGRGILEKQNSNSSTNSSNDMTSTASTYPSPRDPHSVANSTTSTTTPTTTALTADKSLHKRLSYLLTVPSLLERIVNNADLISLQGLINNVFLPQCVIKTSSLPEPG